MTAAQPPADAPIDWESLVEIDDQAGELARRGELDEAAFRKLWAQAKAAVGAHVDMLETLRMLAPASLDPESL